MEFIKQLFFGLVLREQALLFLLPFGLFSFPITESHIDRYPISEIEKEMNSVYVTYPELIERYDAAKPLFQEIIANEKIPGFFGYHGSTHSFRLFQDILRVLYQDYLDIPIPEDFQFMRVPGDPLFDMIEGTKSYYDLFEPLTCAMDTRNLLIQELVLNPFHRHQGIYLHYKELSEQENRLLFESIKKNLLSKTWPKGSTLPTYKAQNLALKQLKKNYTAKIEKLFGSDPAKAHKKKILLDLVDQLENVPSITQDPSHHLIPLFSSPPGSKKGHLVKELKGLLRIDSLLEALFAIAEKENTYEHYQKILQFVFPYWDTRPEQQSRVISINFSLYANHSNLGESTLHVFLANESIEGGERTVTAILEALFEQLGLKKELVAPLFEEGLIWLHERSKTGALYQFFDKAADFRHLNRAAYVSEPFGIPVKEIFPSDIALGSISPFREHQPFQLRLLTSNQETLHPYKGMQILRFDLLTKEERETLLEMIRDRILHSSHDESRRTFSKKNLESLWFN